MVHLRVGCPRCREPGPVSTDLLLVAFILLPPVHAPNWTHRCNKIFLVISRGICMIYCTVPPLAICPPCSDAWIEHQEHPSCTLLRLLAVLYFQLLIVKQQPQKLHLRAQPLGFHVLQHNAGPISQHAYQHLVERAGGAT